MVFLEEDFDQNPSLNLNGLSEPNRLEQSDDFYSVLQEIDSPDHVD